MKATLFFMIAAVVATQGAQQVLPDPYPDSQYEKLKTEWPFILAKPPENVDEPKISWAQNLYLSSVVMQRTAEGGEQPWVTIKDRQEPTSFVQLTLNEEKNGIQLGKIENLDDPRKTTVTVKKNNEFATLKRDESAFAATAPVAPPGAPRPGAVRPGQPPAIPLNNPQNSIKIPGTQPLPGSAPRGPTIPKPSSVIPPPNVPVAPQPGMAPASQPDARKRIRVINNGATR